MNSPLTYLASQEAMASNSPKIAITKQEIKIQAYDSTIVHESYLILHVPPAETCPKVKKIKIGCESHSQGLTGDEKYSYSWGDLVVKSSSGVEVYRQKRAYVNDAVDSNYKMHVQLYDENDEIVQKCAPGSTLELVLCAQYDLWSNSAKYGQITIDY